MKLRPQPVPEWARQLEIEVYKAANDGRLKYAHPDRCYKTVQLWEWFNLPSRESSSGRCWPGLRRIQIVAGTDEQDQKLVVLHELAHMLRPDREYHSEMFWMLAFELYRLFDIDPAYAVRREHRYKTKAMKAAAAQGFPVENHHVTEGRKAAVGISIGTFYVRPSYGFADGAMKQMPQTEWAYVVNKKGQPRHFRKPHRELWLEEYRTAYPRREFKVELTSSWYCMILWRDKV